MGLHAYGHQLHMQQRRDAAEQAADAVLDKLYQRRGYDDLWDSFTGTLQKEIRAALVDVLQEVYET